ncbi:divalent-cation tolerance protein CutA [Candidatus Saccharibacteria bacterium]|nr:divalent-cation tolerance protein CutA [Candidatus Saccharibacteria bacterium]
MVDSDNFCQLWLTCADKAGANKIAKTLLDKRLVACVRQIPVASDFHWRGKIQHANEIMLLMESRGDLFDEIEREVAKLHNYDTFVLEATPVTKISKKAGQWLKGELKNVR